MNCIPRLCYVMTDVAINRKPNITQCRVFAVHRVHSIIQKSRYMMFDKGMSVEINM